MGAGRVLMSVAVVAAGTAAALVFSPAETASRRWAGRPTAQHLPAGAEPSLVLATPSSAPASRPANRPLSSPLPVLPNRIVGWERAVGESLLIVVERANGWAIRSRCEEVLGLRLTVAREGRHRVQHVLLTPPAVEIRIPRPLFEATGWRTFFWGRSEGAGALTGREIRMLDRVLRALFGEADGSSTDDFELAPERSESEVQRSFRRARIERALLAAVDAGRRAADRGDWPAALKHYDDALSIGRWFERIASLPIRAADLRAFWAEARRRIPRFAEEIDRWDAHLFRGPEYIPGLRVRRGETLAEVLPRLRALNEGGVAITDRARRRAQPAGRDVGGAFIGWDEVARLFGLHVQIKGDVVWLDTELTPEDRSRPAAYAVWDLLPRKDIRFDGEASGLHPYTSKALARALHLAILPRWEHLPNVAVEVCGNGDWLTVSGPTAMHKEIRVFLGEYRAHRSSRMERRSALDEFGLLFNDETDRLAPESPAPAAHTRIWMAPANAE